MRSRSDDIAIVEACYDVDVQSDREWLVAIAETVMPLVASRGLVAYLYASTPDARLVPTDFVFRGDVGGASEDMMRGVLSSIPAEMTRMFASIPCLLGREAPFEGREHVWPMLEARGVRDTFVLNGCDPTGKGVFIGAALGKEGKLGRRQRQTWSKIAAHIASGYRLRRRLRGEEQPSEAIVDVKGKVEHAAPAAKSRTALEALKHAAVAIETARGKLRRSDPDAAVDEWRGLIAARWTLVEHFESDGKRYFLAKRNDVPVATVKNLTPRELQAVAFASLGHSNKLIAYEMGVSASTVGVLLSRAAKRIGVHSREALIAAFTNAQTR